MKNIDIQTLYKLLFADYPDIVTVRQLQPCWASAATRPTTC